MQTEGQVNISLYDASGRLVSNLVNEAKSAGTHSTAIESDEIAAGVYFVKVETPDGTGTKTMTIVR
jgi:flagellar hook assembly protein FlgD